MKLIYTHENPMLVAHAKNLLQQQGLEVIIKNEFARGAAGDIAVLDTWPEVWVLNDRDYATAVEIVKSATCPPSASHWVCDNCGEENAGSFEHCWNCQNERP